MVGMPLPCVKLFIATHESSDCHVSRFHIAGNSCGGEGALSGRPARRVAKAPGAPPPGAAGRPARKGEGPEGPSEERLARRIGRKVLRMLGQVMSKLSGGVGFLGSVLIVMGLVNLGMSLKDGAQGGGGQLAGAIAMIVGGGVIVGAAVYFGTLDTSWAG